jgi:hypothetical protein
VLSGVVVTDNCTAAKQITLSQSPAAGATVARGQSTITVTATDASGNSSTATVSLNVVDTTAPVIHSLTVNPSVLWPPNHQIVPVTVTVAATDNCDAAPVSRITGITCNETAPAADMQLTGALTANLAASKNSSGGTRVYTLTIQCTDASGNSSTGTVTVTVPHNNGKP